MFLSEAEAREDKLMHSVHNKRLADKRTDEEVLHQVNQWSMSKARREANLAMRQTMDYDVSNPL